MPPRRIKATDLAREWGISPTRVYALQRSGDLQYVPGTTLFDYDAAMAFRADQIARNPVRTLFARHDNGSGVHIERKADTILRATAQSSDDEDDDDLLALDAEEDNDDLLELPVKEPPKPASAQDAVLIAMQRTEQMQDIKLKTAQEALRAKEAKRLREEGRVITREEAFRVGAQAGRLIVSMLRTLPLEIAGEFPDKDTRNMVRIKVEDVVDKMQHALFAKLEAMTPDDFDEG